ncbi:MAG: oligoribonuclease [Proteobacteria bacterium]|jgi:oligoribonuclease|nr:oligoribonuclease [Pseudomonadota bacterium]NLN61850.1 oligoribonuclease [Myxococcales bacterium]
MPKNDVLVWMDLEMTGLEPETDRILEMAVLITDGALNVLEQGPTLVVHQSDAVLDGMDEWNQSHHGASGLIERVRSSTLDEAAAEAQLLAFVQAHTDRRAAPLCGNSIWQDRRFIAKYMPQLDGWLHYRNIDVSTIKELARRWYPGLAPFQKTKAHTALSDIVESIAELRFYRDHIFIRSAD